jgi:hypothetical protein
VGVGEGAREAVIGAVGPIWQPPVSPRYRAETAIGRASDQIDGATMISHDGRQICDDLASAARWGIPVD